MNFKPIETDENVLVMPGAVVCGDVTVGEGTAFWFNSVCRAELQPIKIGKRCNIQDCAVIHNLCTLGDDVSVGHGAIVHGATVGDRVIVGMGAIVLDGAKIGDDCIIAAGAVVTGKMDAVNFRTDLRCGKRLMARPHGIVPAPAVVVGANVSDLAPRDRERAALHLFRVLEYLGKGTLGQEL